jgi:cation transporter-like permease
MIEALLALGVGTIGGVAGVVVAVILVAVLGRRGVDPDGR